jgi:hypothetical protein
MAAPTDDNDGGGDSHYDHSVLDDLGAEVTGIAFPVSICMALVIALVRLLNRDGQEPGKKVVIAELYYNEQARFACRMGECMVRRLTLLAVACCNLDRLPLTPAIWDGSARSTCQQSYFHYPVYQHITLSNYIYI